MLACNYAQETSMNTGTDIHDSVSVALNTGVTIDHSDFTSIPAFSPLQLIQGKVPGATINNLNGNNPNAGVEVQIRGLSTIGLHTDPLYVVDGIILQNIDFILPENIESIKVLRSLSETSQYGILGSNGVFIIATKKDYSRQLAIHYDTYGFVESFAKKNDYLSAGDWRRFKNRLASSTDPVLQNDVQLMDDNGANTDWRTVISQNRLSQSHRLGISGTYLKTTYSANLNFNDFKGIIQKENNQKISGQFAVSQLALRDKLKIDGSFTTTSIKYSDIIHNAYLGKEQDFGYGPISFNFLKQTLSYNPTVINMNNTVARDTVGGSAYITEYNPLYKLNSAVDERKTANYLTNLGASYEIIKGLKATVSYAFSKISKHNFYSYTDEMGTYRRGSDTIVQVNKIFDANLNYRKLSGAHHFDVLIAYSSRLFSNCNNHFEVIKNINFVENLSENKPEENTKISGMLGSLKYDFDNKYFLSFGILNEKSVLYNLQITQHYNPSFSCGWLVNKETFFKNKKWLDELLLKVSYGSCQQPLFFNTIPSIGNPELHGEKLIEKTVGIDFRLFSSRFCVTANYYNRKTSDGVIFLNLSPYLFGGNHLKAINILGISNKGWEFELNGQPIMKPINWSVAINFSMNKNTSTANGAVSNSVWKHNGQSLGDFYGYRFAGISDDGKVLRYEKNGDKTTEATDITVIGNGTPKTYFGVTNKFAWKNLDLSIFIKGALGFDVQNFDKTTKSVFFNFKNSIFSKDPREIKLYSQLIQTDYYLEKGDYLKIQEISISYSIPTAKKTIKSAKIYVSCNNVALFTKFTGGDPEMAGINGQTPGLYLNPNYPLTRIFLLGLKIEI